MAEIYIGTEAGVMIMGSDAKLPEGFDPRKRPWYQAAMAAPGETIVTDPYVDAVTGNIIIGVARALADRSGVVSLDMQLETLEAVVKQANIGESGYMAIYDKHGATLVHPAYDPGEEHAEAWMEQLYAQEEGRFALRDGEKQAQAVFVTNPRTGWKVMGVMYEAEADQVASPIFQKNFRGHRHRDGTRQHHRLCHSARHEMCPPQRKNNLPPWRRSRLRRSSWKDWQNS